MLFRSRVDDHDVTLLLKGVPKGDIVVVDPQRRAIEAANTDGLAGVVGELTRLSLTDSRRLQLCAGASGVSALAIRRWWNANERALSEEPSAACTRWRRALPPAVRSKNLPPSR